MRDDAPERIYQCIAEAVINHRPSPTGNMLARAGGVSTFQLNAIINKLVRQGRIRIEQGPIGKIYYVDGIEGSTDGTKRNVEVRWTPARIAEWNRGHLELYVNYVRKVANAQRA